MQGLKEVKELSSVHHFLKVAKFKAAFAHFKHAASIFDYIASTLIKHQRWSHKTVKIPEMFSILNLTMSKVTQTHAVMSIFEKTIHDEADTELLAKNNMTQNYFIAKIAKKVLDNIHELIDSDHLLDSMLAKLQVTVKDIDSPNYYEYLKFIQPLWEVIYNAYYGVHLYMEKSEMREGMACVKQCEIEMEVMQKKVQDAPSKLPYTQWKYWANLKLTQC